MTKSRSGRRTARTAFLSVLVAASVLVAVQQEAAIAVDAAISDTDDVGSVLDIETLVASNTETHVTYTLTMHGSFAPTDVDNIEIAFAFGSPLAKDACLQINRSTYVASGLQANLHASCVGGSENEARPAVTKPSADTLTVTVPLARLRDAGLDDLAESYGVRVATDDAASPNTPNEDEAPNTTTDFVTHALVEPPDDICGDTITADLTLEEDIVCEGDGITIGASGTGKGSKANFVTLDLNGFSITGDGTGTGVSVGAFKMFEITGPDGEDNVITGFGTGISLDEDAQKGVISNLTVEDNDGDGIQLNGAKHSLSENVITGNGDDGISQDTGKGSKLLNNVTGENDGDGFDSESTSVQLGGTTADNNGGDGINAQDKKGVKVLKVKEGKKKVPVPNKATGNAGTNCTPTRLCED